VRLTRQEIVLLCAVLLAVTTGAMAKRYRSAHPADASSHPADAFSHSADGLSRPGNTPPRSGRAATPKRSLKK
jgi:hypothetical protein